MPHAAVAMLLSSLAIGSVGAQERLFRPADLAPRLHVAAELKEVMERHADLPTTVALAAIAGVGLPEGSAAARQLGDALRTAIARDGDSASRRLRSDLGDLIAVLTFEPLMQAELPEGFPRFGVVGEIELREYPKYRMARTEMPRGSTSAFWPLFRHIQSNDIAMTTPVQMDFDGMAANSRPVNMAFLYGSLAIEPEKTAENIEVVEVPAQTVLTIGAIGSDRRDLVEALGARLWAFLNAPGCLFEACGPLRTMGYNSPMVPTDRRYFEVQIPVRPRAF